jgi:hypothetical protein
LGDNIEIDLHGIGYDCVDWINVAQGRHEWKFDVYTAMILQDFIKAESFFAI